MCNPISRCYFRSRRRLALRFQRWWDEMLKDVTKDGNRKRKEKIGA